MQVYEDATHVYVVMEMCRGPSLEAQAGSGDLREADVARYMRSVVRTIVQVHDTGDKHGAVAPSKFMLLSEDRDADVKATGFGRAADAPGEGAQVELVPSMDCLSLFSKSCLLLVHATC